MCDGGFEGAGCDEDFSVRDQLRRFRGVSDDRDVSRCGGESGDREQRDSLHCRSEGGTLGAAEEDGMQRGGLAVAGEAGGSQAVGESVFPQIRPFQVGPRCFPPRIHHCESSTHVSSFCFNSSIAH